MDQALAVYLPVDRRHALATGTPLLDRTQGAALFADISGFTRLTEALTQALGPRRGAEELPRQLNLVYDALIREVDRYGGSVISFAGDAITCWFDGDSGLRATACGLAMQAAMRAFAKIDLPSGGTTSLAMKVAVASGAVRRFLVGDPRVQLIDTLAGATLHRMAAAEHVAQKGEVVLDEHSARALSEFLEVQRWRSDKGGNSFAVVSGLRQSVTPQPWRGLPSGRLRPEALRPWLLPTIYERLQAGQGEFLTELRPAVALFLRFSGIEYDSDPEAGQKLDAFVRWVQGLLVKYEGALLQLTIGEKGSYLYAAFGAPIAHEDDDRRAVQSALDLRVPPPELSFLDPVQIGLSRGTMRTGAYGGSTRRTYGSLGDEVNLAARLMQHAPPGQVIASGRIQAATAHLFRWRFLPPLRVKGKRDEVARFALDGPLPPLTPHLEEPTYLLPMIGRTAERDLIVSKIDLVLQGQGQLLGITAEAGMGKSRLVAEVIREARARALVGYGSKCYSFGTHSPYLVWHSIGSTLLHLNSEAPLPDQVRMLERALLRINPSLVPRLPLLGTILNLPLPDNELTRFMSAQLRKEAREAMMVECLRAAAREHPLLLVLEDAHWMDLLSQELLEVIGRAIAALPVLIVLAYRPTGSEPAPGSTQPYFTEVALSALSTDEIGQLISNKLGAERLPGAPPIAPALERYLIERAEGNPFHMEEILNYLQGQGLDLQNPELLQQVDLPTSLHALILSRIDQLSESQKVTIKVASVIGRLFRLAWLCGYYPSLGEPEQVHQELEVLHRLNLTLPDDSEPELAYLFKHIITQEVAYESLAYATRAMLHEQLASFLEGGIAAGKGPEVSLDLLAYHYSRSENLVKKKEYLQRAGEAAQAAFANAAALEHYSHLLPILSEPAEQIELHLKLGEILAIVGRWDEAEMRYRTALTLAGEMDLLTLQARCQQRLGYLLRDQGSLAPALEQLSEARERFEAVGEQSGLVLALRGIGSILWQQGNLEAAQPLIEESLSLARRLADQHATARALDYLVIMALAQGAYPHARALAEEALAIARAMGNRLTISEGLGILGGVALAMGDYAAARAHSEEALAICREIDYKRGIGWALGNLGAMAYNQGDYATAQTCFEESTALCRELGAHIGVIWGLLFLGAIVLAQGERAQARSYLVETLLLAGEAEDRRVIAHALAGMAAVARAFGQDEPAACLAAAAEAMLRAAGVVLEPILRTLHERTLPEIRSALPERTFMQAWMAGEAMTPEQAVAYAVGLRLEPLPESLI